MFLNSRGRCRKRLLRTVHTACPHSCMVTENSTQISLLFMEHMGLRHSIPLCLRCRWKLAGKNQDMTICD